MTDGGLKYNNMLCYIHNVDCYSAYVGHNIIYCYILTMPPNPSPRTYTDAAQRIYRIAEDQHGYFTARQAREAGVNPMAVVMMAGRGAVERTSHGVYRVVRFPAGSPPLGQYVEASLWPHGTRGVISHESALALYEMSDANPSKLHITVPAKFRIRRKVPGYLVVHHADLQPHEIQPFEGIPVTAPERTIRDCHARHLPRALIRQAIDDARRHGLLTMRDAARLQDELGRPGAEGEP